MKLGVYRRLSSESDSEEYIREGVYDFEASEWDDSTRGEIVMKASRNPTPQELIVRFETDANTRNTIVRTPESMRKEGFEISVANSDMSVEQGHANREERDGPVITQTELEYRKQQKVSVFPDDFELTELDRETAKQKGHEIVRKSDWDGLDFEAEFDYDVGFEY